MNKFQDLQNGRFYWADCFDAMKEIPDGVVDMILCDLPYGTTACAWDSVLPFDQLWKEYCRVTKSNAAIVLTASQPFTSALGASNLSMLKYAWFWRKTRATGHLNAKKMPMKDIEEILVFYGSLPTYNPQGLKPLGKVQRNSASHIARGISSEATSVVTGGITKREYTQESTGYPRQVLDFASEGSTVHPTQKPVALFEYLIKTYTNENELILDNAAGSGTTAIAAINTNRKWICIEKDETYANKAIERIRNHVNG